MNVIKFICRITHINIYVNNTKNGKIENQLEL